MNRRALIGKTTVVPGLFLLLLVSSAFGQNGQAGSNTPLSVTFALHDAITIVGDQLGAYVDQMDNVRAEFTYGNFYLDTNEMKGDRGRRIYISTICSGTIGGIPCPDPGPKDVYIATIDPGDVHVDLAGLSLNESWDKRFAINWAEGDYTYHLRWNYPVDPQHGNVRFTCNAADVNGSCVQWVASPTGSVGLFGKSNARKSNEVLMTTKDVSFQLILTKQP